MSDGPEVGEGFSTIYANMNRDPRFPNAIEVRTADRKVRHLIDYSALSPEAAYTIDGYIHLAVTAVAELRAALIEDAILEGHDRIEVQVEGQPTTVHTLPSWWTETRAWAKVKWARWRHNHPEAGERFWFALRYLGTPWSAGTLR